MYIYICVYKQEDPIFPYLFHAGNHTLDHRHLRPGVVDRAADGFDQRRGRAAAEVVGTALSCLDFWGSARVSQIAMMVLTGWQYSMDYFGGSYSFSWHYSSILVDLPFLWDPFLGGSILLGWSILCVRIEAILQAASGLKQGWHASNHHLNMFAANPRFARGESRISFDMLKSLRRVEVFYFPKQQTLKP